MTYSDIMTCYNCNDLCHFKRDLWDILDSKSQLSFIVDLYRNAERGEFNEFMENLYGK
jgi:hypothetical protein